MGLDEIRKASSGKKEDMDDTDVGFETLLVVGGGSNNKLWRKIISDILNVTLKFPVEAESAALGVAFQAGAAVTGKSVEEYVLDQKVQVEDDIVTPSYQNGQMYEEYSARYEMFQSLSKKLYD